MEVPESKHTEMKNNKNGISLQPKKMRSKKKLYIIFTISVILFIGGITVGVLWSTIFNNILTKELVLKPETTAFKIWNENPIPIYLSFYLFNWTNPQNLSCTYCEKPTFTEHGPYVFSEKVHKVDKVWNSNQTVTFNRKRFWTFEPEMSNGSLSDEITNLNPVAVTVSYMMRAKNPFMRKFIGVLMKVIKENLIVKKNISQLIFDGYDDKLLNIAKKFNSTLLPFDKFGWFYGRNGSETYEGSYNVRTGEDQLSEAGKLAEWNYSDKVIYNNRKCESVKGTIGDFWHPFEVNETSTIDVFSSDICTSFNLKYDNKTDFMGVTGEKFISHENILDNGTNVPSRKCYCENAECVPSGALNVSLCKFGAPAFISLPHFHLGDPSYRKNIIGMKPDEKKHGTYLILDPIMGITMEVKAQLQLNLMIQGDEKIEMFKGMNRTFVPMLWFSQTAALNSEYASLLKFMHIVPLLGMVTFYGIAGIGALLFFIGVYITLKMRWAEEENQNLISRGADRDNNSIVTSQG